MVFVLRIFAASSSQRMGYGIYLMNCISVKKLLAMLKGLVIKGVLFGHLACRIEGSSLFTS